MKTLVACPEPPRRPNGHAWTDGGSGGNTSVLLAAGTTGNTHAVTWLRLDVTR
ncbi:hypothetical protein ACFFX1_55085 [Dactylosporangium sucinum]|uniref:Uncharacterized protein n=1 Tax=Dactylosporangium sucinum TaxID=1424081 RepID=A0A917U4M3_9ACTN|nr:hypothetical protein [Dactylosporangium sucinum]GGM53108.1 hypothetical protein GCM10007977_063430 [Dactylosporangium sucinum]